MHATRRLWTWLAIIGVLSFATLLLVGREIYLKLDKLREQYAMSGGLSPKAGERAALTGAPA